MATLWSRGNVCQESENGSNRRTGEEREAWIVDYTDQHGERHIETFDRKKDADARHAEVTVDVQKGVHIAPSKTPTLKAAGESWLKASEVNGLERTTLDQYRQHLKYHLEPFIGSLKLAEITPPVVRKLEGDLLEAGRSKAMVRKVLVSLGSILADAQEQGLAARNAVRELRRNRRKGKERHAAKREKGKLKVGVDIPSPDEIKAILAHAKGRWRPFLVTAAFTGLRASELRGLRWVDVDLKANELHVRQRADRYRQIGEPKSGASERTVPLPPSVTNILREWKLESALSGRGFCVPQQQGRRRVFHQHIIKRGLKPGADRGGRREQGRHGEIHRPARAAAFLCFLVHQPDQGWRAWASAQERAGAARPRHHHHDARHLRTPVPWRRQQVVGRRGGHAHCDTNATCWLIKQQKQ